MSVGPGSNAAKESRRVDIRLPRHHPPRNSTASKGHRNPRLHTRLRLSRPRPDTDREVLRGLALRLALGLAQVPEGGEARQARPRGGVDGTD